LFFTRATSRPPIPCRKFGSRDYRSEGELDACPLRSTVLAAGVDRTTGQRKTQPPHLQTLPRTARTRAAQYFNRRRELREPASPNRTHAGAGALGQAHLNRPRAGDERRRFERTCSSPGTTAAARPIDKLEPGHEFQPFTPMPTACRTHHLDHRRPQRAWGVGRFAIESARAGATVILSAERSQTRQCYEW